MAKAVKTAENQLRQAVLDALGQAVAAGELPAEPVPASPEAEKDPLDDLLSFGGQFDNITIQ